MSDAAAQLVLSNALALVGAIFLIVQLIYRDKGDMFRTLSVSMGIMVVAFFVMGCWSAVVTSLFSLAISVYEAFCFSPRNSIRIILSLASAAAAALVQSWAAGLDFFTALPVISALLTGFGFCFSGGAGIMRVVQGCDSALWLVYDVYYLLFANVFCDLVGVVFVGAYAYLQKFDPDDGYWESNTLSLRRSGDGRTN